MKITKYSELPPDGFAGVRMREIVKDNRLFGLQGGMPHASGIGNLVYMADAIFIPYGDTRMHPHVEIDVVTIVLKGRILHQGSLGDGQVLQAHDVQIQRAGGKGFMHNEVNPDPEVNHVLQIWLLPERPDLATEYHVYPVTQKGMTRVYGGSCSQNEVLPAETVVDIAKLDKGDVLQLDGLTQIYVIEGTININTKEAVSGDFVEITNPRCLILSECILVVFFLKSVSSALPTSNKKASLSADKSGHFY